MGVSIRFCCDGAGGLQRRSLDRLRLFGMASTVSQTIDAQLAAVAAVSGGTSTLTRSNHLTSKFMEHSLYLSFDKRFGTEPAPVCN